MRRIAFVVASLLALPAWSQVEAQPPPALPEGYQGEAPTPEQEVLEPQVTIIRRERDVIEEYRVNGRLYMVKITPTAGYPYYLIDSDGDGSLETRRNDMQNPEIPQWVLFRW